MKLAIKQAIPAQYDQAQFKQIVGALETQGNLLAEGRLSGRHFNATVAPTTGDFAKGDIVWNSTPSDGGVLGWVCTASGSPGTLKSFGFIGFDSVVANKVFAGPSSGADAAPSFRALTIGDIPGLSQLTASLAADVALNNTANYFTGPSLSQGSTGIWYASGTVVIVGSATDLISAKLWDGTNVIASARTQLIGANDIATISLSGYISAPSGNIRISVRDENSTTANIKANSSGNGKDSTITAFRLP